MRRIFRWLRMAFLLLVLLLAGFLFYWHQTGLPDFVKNALLAALNQRGLELNFQAIHFRWDRGLVAQGVEFGRSQMIAGPRLIAEEVQIIPDAGAALRGRLQINLLRLRNGQLTWHFAGASAPPAPLVISRLQTELRFGDNSWELRELACRFHEVDFRLNGVISNAAAFAGQWAAARSRSADPAAEARVHAALRDFAHALTNWHFSGQPSAALDFNLDANDWPGARFHVKLQAGAATIPWGEAAQLTLQADRIPAKAEAGRADVFLIASAQSARTRWGELTSAQLTARTYCTTGAFWTTNVQASLQARRLQTTALQFQDLRLDVDFSPEHTNVNWGCAAFSSPWMSASQAAGSVRSLAPADDLAHPWQISLNATNVVAPSVGQCRQLQLQATVDWFAGVPLQLRSASGQAGCQAWHWPTLATGLTATLRFQASGRKDWWAKLSQTNETVWQRLEPLTVQGDLTLTSCRVDRLDLDELGFAGSWQFPQLVVSNLQASLLGGFLAGGGHWDAQTRQLQVAWTNRLDPGALAPWLNTNVVKALNLVTCEQPPLLQVSLKTTLPQQVQWPTQWLAAVWSNGVFDARLLLTNAQYQSVPLSALKAAVHRQGERYRIDELELWSGEQWLRGAGELTEAGDFAWEVQFQALPDPWLPLLSTNVQSGLKLAQLSQPMAFIGRLNGNWRQWETLEVEGEVRATNFTFQGVAIEELQTRVHWATNTLTFDAPLIRRSEGTQTAERVIADFARQMIYLRQARGRVDPMAVAQAIGPHVVATIAPYRFAGLVEARVSGDIPMHGEAGARVTFELAGSAFAWWRFHASNLTATVLWRDYTATITNFAADFYGGHLRGDLVVDFTRPQQETLALNLHLSQAQFAGLMADISDRTNRVEGLLSGKLAAQALLHDWNSWNGQGQVELTDGLIWDIPIFGFFSPVLNAISPGLGNSRAREGRATFIIRDSVIYSEDLEIQATGYNLKYRGSVDFDYRIQARVEAEVLRETKLLGPALSLFFKPFTKLFEYRITGTLSNPKAKPVYLPGFLMKLLTPIRTVRELVQPEPSAPPPPAGPPANPKAP